MSDTRVTGWVGWGWFAGVALIIVGTIDAIYGLIAITAPNSAYFVRVEGELYLFNTQGWGWFHLIMGIALILVAAALFSGATWARVVTIIVVSIHAIVQLFTLPTQPWLSLILLAIDILVIYALTVHGRELEIAART